MIESGYSWFVGESAGYPIYSLFGREYGFQGHMAICPDANLAVIAVGNGEIIETYYASDLAADVLGMLLAEFED